MIMETLPRPDASVPTQREWKLLDLMPVLEALKGLRFGSAELFVQDSRLMQIDRKEKIRFFKT